MLSIEPAIRLSSKTHQYPGKLLVTETFFQVPTDYANPEAGSLRVFVRSTERFRKPVAIKQGQDDQPPLLLYLEGGPGFECRSPANTSWINIILDKGYKVVLMDQRGTGLSTPVSARFLASLGDPQRQAEHLTLFRADNIVRDCEAIRKAMTLGLERETWSLLGQSFGGFCAVHYLSKYPSALQEVFIAGGLPPLSKNCDDVYSKLFEKVRKRNRIFYDKFPEDIDRVKSIIKHLQKHAIMLPSGGILSVRRFRQLGISFGFHGSLESTHELILRLDSDLTHLGYLSRQSLSLFESWQPFDDAPLYALIHEAIYAEGCATQWSASRVLHSLPDFADSPHDPDQPILFTGEMIFRDMFNDYAELMDHVATADLLASYSKWPTLYDEAQLATNEVDVYAAVYTEDMYVHYDFAKETASKIKRCKVFVTNALYHNAIGARSGEVLDHLFSLRDDVID